MPPNHNPCVYTPFYIIILFYPIKELNAPCTRTQQSVLFVIDLMEAITKP